MAKAYWIARIDVGDPDAYKLYVEAAKPAFERFGAKFLARGGKSEAVEGVGRGRNVVIEFASMQDALGCYRSPEYARARGFREQASSGDIVIVEGI